MLIEMYGKGGRVCQPAKAGDLRCGLIVRPTSEDVITANLCQVLRVLNPRWWLPDVLNIALKARRFRRQVYRGLTIEPWRNRPRYPKDLLPWDEGSTQIDCTLRWENPPTTVYLETKYLADLSPRTTNGHADFPSDQLIRNIRVGLLECGWFSRDGQPSPPPRDFVMIVLGPTKGHPLVTQYQQAPHVLGATPFSERLMGLPRTPFVGELTFGDLVRILHQQEKWLTRPERQLAAELCEYLTFKMQRSHEFHIQRRLRPPTSALPMPGGYQPDLASGPSSTGKVPEPHFAKKTNSACGMGNVPSSAQPH